MRKNIISPKAPVSPILPNEARDADQDNAGSINSLNESRAAAFTPAQERRAASGSSASGGGSAAASGDEDEEEDESPDTSGWIEIEMKFDDDTPIAGEPVIVTLPDGSEANRRLDSNGYLKIEGFEPGECTVRFPDFENQGYSDAN